jgi:hypothetical protein
MICLDFCVSPEVLSSDKTAFQCITRCNAIYLSLRDTQEMIHANPAVADMGYCARKRPVETHAFNTITNILTLNWLRN